MRAAWLLLLCGCELVYSVTPPDERTVTGSYARTRVTNDADGNPTRTREVYPLARLALSVVLDDGSAPGVDYDPATGAFSFVRATPEQGYRLTRALDGDRLEYQAALAHLDLSEAAVGRDAALPATPGTDLTFTVSAVPLDGEVVSTGVWMISPELHVPPPSFTLDWSQMNRASAVAPGVLDAAAGDRLYVIAATPSDGSSAPYLGATAYAELAVTMHPGSAQDLAAPLVPAPPTCASFEAPYADELARLEAALPGSDDVPQQGQWFVQVVPAPDLGPDGALTLAYATDPAYPTATNQPYAASVVTPMPGQVVVATEIGTARHADAGGTSITLTAAASHTWQPVARGGSCADNTLPAAPEAGVPHALALAGVPIDVPDAVVPATADATLAWAMDAPADVYRVTIEDVTVAPGAFVAQIVTLAPSAVIAVGTLHAGHAYALTVDAIVGMPTTGGQIGPSTLPRAETTAGSYVFTAQ